MDKEASSVFRACESLPRIAEYDSLFDRLCDKFCDTLEEKQQIAFNVLMDMSIAIRSDCIDIGIAYGIHIAAEMQKMISNPVEALHQAQSQYMPITELLNVKALYEYLESHRKDGT